MMQVSGYVLAGGESSRMQSRGMPRHKALISLYGETLLERSLKALRAVCTDMAVLCGPRERSSLFGTYGRTVPDRLPGKGPVSGVDAALCDAASGWILVMPVDLPLLPSAALRLLIDKGTRGGPTVACLSAAGRLQPLPVLLHKSAAPSVAASLAGREHTLTGVLEGAAQEMSSAGLCVVRAEAFAQAMEAAVWFTNVNSPDDYRAACKLVAAQNGLR